MTQHLTENPYLQFFVGLTTFHLQPPFDSSTLTNVRKRLGEKEFDDFEQSLINDLIEHKLLKPKGLLIDATVCNSYITYPTDCGLLNKARQYCVTQIKKYSKIVGTKVRTYYRKAQQEYLSFNKKRNKTHHEIRRMQKKMLQYLRRNLNQVTELIDQVIEKGHVISTKVSDRIEVIKTIYDQQRYMYTNRLKSIESRIVSLHQPHVRPIVRNKAGRKVEFGPKVAMSLVDGFLFADRYSNENFNENTTLEQVVENFEKRFGKTPDYVAMDQIYGTRENRAYLKSKGIRSSVKKLGRKKQDECRDKEHRWRKQKQRERNRIEGGIGYIKTKHLLDEVRAKLPQTEYSWVRFGLLSHNLATVAKRI